MPQYTKQQLEERYNKLPDALKDALFSVDIAHTMFEIGKRNLLTIEKTGFLAEETGYVILGLTHPENLAANLQEKLSVDDEELIKIVSEVNKEVFLPIREMLKKTHGVEVATEPTRPRVPEAGFLVPPLPSAPIPSTSDPQKNRETVTKKPEQDALPPKTVSPQPMPPVLQKPAAPAVPFKTVVSPPPLVINKLPPTLTPEQKTALPPPRPFIVPPLVSKSPEEKPQPSVPVSLKEDLQKRVFSPASAPRSAPANREEKKEAPKATEPIVKSPPEGEARRGGPPPQARPAPIDLRTTPRPAALLPKPETIHGVLFAPGREEKEKQEKPPTSPQSARPAPTEVKKESHKEVDPYRESVE